MADHGALSPQPQASLGKDAALMTGSSVAATALGAVASIVIARELGVAGRGEWAVIGSLAVLVGTVGTMGLPAAGAYGAARVPASLRPAFVRAALIAALALGLAAAVVYLLIAEASDPVGAENALLLGGAIAGALVLHHVVQQVVLTTAPFAWFAAAQALPAAAMLAAVASVAAIGDLSLVAVVAVSAGSSLLGALVGLVGLVSGGVLPARPALARASEMADVLRPYAGYALVTLATIGLTQVVHRVDILIVEAYGGAHDAGLYATAVQVGDVLLVAPAAVGLVLFRRGATEVEGHWDDAVRSIGWTAALAALTALIVGILAPSLIRLVFGDPFVDGSSALRWLLPGVVLLSVQSVVSNYVAGRGRPRAVLLAWGTAACVGIALDFVLVPAYGIDGAGIASTVSYVTVLAMHLPAMRSMRPERA